MTIYQQVLLVAQYLYTFTYAVPTDLPSGIPTEIPSVSPEDISSIQSYYSAHSSELSDWANSAMSALPSDVRESVSSAVAAATNAAAGHGESAATKATVGVAVAGSVFLAAVAGMLM